MMRLFLLVFTLWITTTVCSSFAFSTENLFVTPSGDLRFSTNTAITDSTPVKRSRLVEVALTHLGDVSDPATKISINLFDDTVYTATHIRSEPVSNGFSWIGRLEGVDLSQVVFIVSDDMIMGSISLPGANYTISFYSGELHAIKELDLGSFPEELEPIELPDDNLRKTFESLEVSGDESCVEMTVLVAYTPEARAAAGGTSAIQTLINLAITETNTSYSNSGLTQRITLVHTMETDAGEAANSFGSDLSALYNRSDGIFDRVDAYRELYHADLVGLIIENGSSCGLGYVNSSASSAFSVTHRTCATGYYSFGHELGHNMGARHDWYVDDSNYLNNDYSKAYVNFEDNWRTIMGYNRRCTDSGQNCSRIQYWSNPEITYGSPPDDMGVTIGTATNCVEDSLSPDPQSCDADNRSKLNLTCDTVADFRLAPPTEPDLIAFSPEVDNESLHTGQSYTLSANAGNAGGLLSTATTLHYYLSTNTTISTSDTELGTDSVGPLAVSLVSSQNISLFAPGTPGTYYLGACIDSSVGETQTTNNCSTSVVITVSNPDLIVQSPSVNDSTLSPSENFTLSATVENQGDGTSDASTLRYYLSTDSTISATDSEEGTDTVSTLAPLATSAENIVLSAPSSPGIYYFGGCVDSVTGESDTNNNCSSAVTITVNGSPDLIVQSPGVNDSSPIVGDNITFSATVHNQGGNSSNATTLRYYLSNDSSITTADSLQNTDPVSSLAPLANSSENSSITVPGTPGTYYLGACVDSVTGESDTNNNCSSGVAITVSDRPDLIVQSALVDDSTLTTSESYTLSATVFNQGNHSSDSTTLRYFLSIDATISTGDAEEGSDSVIALAPSANSNESIALNAPSTPGTYYVGACVDSVTDEAEISNNCSAGIQISVSPPGSPDLIVIAPGTDQITLSKGQVYTFSATVENGGSLASASTTLRCYLSNDDTITSADTQIGGESVGILSIDQQSILTTSLNAPGKKGVYYVGACVDSVPGETATGNNCSTAVQISVLSFPWNLFIPALINQ